MNMPLRIGFDMDGVLADFASAFYVVEEQLFGPNAGIAAEPPEREEEAQAQGKGDTEDEPNGEQGPRESRRRRDAIWKVIESTPDFWEALQPLDPGAVRRINDMMLRFRWEVFFITQRPATEGDTVQRQTQRWLIKQGFDMPSVLVLGGSRGRAAGALRLNYHVDDTAQNCLDVIADSKAKPILIVPDEDEKMIASARKLRIATASSISLALDILEQASTARSQPGLLKKLGSLVGWC